jgi:DNA-binding NarL/FixJ family response regulator
VADDTSTLRQLVRGILDSFAPGEFEVVAEAEDGLEAVSAVAEMTPDVILLDLAMPQMSGLEAIPEIRRVSPETKIVVFSGFDRLQVSADIDAAGADAHVEKGIPGERLVAVIRGVVARRPALRAVTDAGDVSSETLQGGLRFGSGTASILD